jgi:hypothetical protein
MKKILKNENFQIIEYKDGVFFGLSDEGVRNG